PRRRQQDFSAVDRRQQGRAHQARYLGGTAALRTRHPSQRQGRGGGEYRDGQWGRRYRERDRHRGETAARRSYCYRRPNAGRDCAVSRRCLPRRGREQPLDQAEEEPVALPLRIGEGAERQRQRAGPADRGQGRPLVSGPRLEQGQPHAFGSVHGREGDHDVQLRRQGTQARWVDQAQCGPGRHPDRTAGSGEQDAGQAHPRRGAPSRRGVSKLDLARDGDRLREDTLVASGRYSSHSMERLLRAAINTWHGLLAAARSEEAFRQELIALVVAVPVAFLIAEEAWKRLALIAVVAFVLVVELLNTAVEKLADRVNLAIDPQIGRVKDMGSAAVGLALLIAGMAWLLALAERLGLI